MIEYWYMFPVSIVISSIAMTIGIGGAAMFTPLFFIFMNLPASIAIGVGLFIEVFGFSSGLLGFAKEKLIEYKVASFLLWFSVPGAIIGVLLSNFFSDLFVKIVFALTLIVLAFLISNPKHHVFVKHRHHHSKDKSTFNIPKSKNSVVKWFRRYYGRFVFNWNW